MFLEIPSSSESGLHTGDCTLHPRINGSNGKESTMLLLWFMTALLHSEQVFQSGSEHHIRVLLENNQLGSSPRQESGRGLNPSVVIIVVILTVVFLLSGFLHLLARCCGRVASRREPTESAMSALHGQLQHLFHLHDSGVDQAFIDTLPVFPYKAICGLKEGTDCAVCLSEFESEDRLRLLPKCKHAFHIDCIDTWLLSHSTCPLCRCALLSDDVSPSNGAFSDSGRLGSNRSMGSHSGFVGDSRRTADISRRIASSSLLAEHGGGSGSELGKDDDNRMGLDSPEIQPVLDGTESSGSVASVLSVKLGRVERRASNHNNSGSILRGRSYSMGSYEYVVDPANLQVVIAPTPYPGRGKSREVAIGGRPRHRSVFSDSIPELGSNPGTPADELFWATRGLATPEFTTKPDGSGTSRLNLGHLAPEASLVPKSLEVVVDDKCKGKDKEWVTIDLEAKEVSGGGVVINKTILPPDKVQESEESRILAGLERFFGSGWRSNVGLERLAESMLKRDKAPMDGSCRSKAASEQGESHKDHSMSRRTFSFRFPVPDSLTRAGRSRRTMSENGGFDTASNKDTVIFDTASKDTGFETASKDGGFETASKESVGGLDTSSVGSFDSSWVGPPSQPLPQPIVNEESSLHAASLARKTIHWLMGRDRRVVGHANFSPSPEAGGQRRDDF